MKKGFYIRLAADIGILMALLLIAPISLHAQNITSYTTNAIVQVGTTATLTVSSTNLVTYQWLFGSTPIGGATSSTLSIAKTQLTNAGFYYISVSDSNSVTTNGPALLDVYTGPQSTNVPGGGDLVLGTLLAGPITPAYQWRFNGTDIAQATDSTLTIPNLQPPNAGGYTLAFFVTNSSSLSAVASVGIVFPATNNPGSIPAPPGLINYWPLDGNFSDAARANDLSPRGNVTMTPAESGYGCSLDGNKNTFLFGVGSSGLLPPWTACFWVNRLDGLSNSAALLGDSSSALKIEQYNKTRKVGVTVFSTADYVFNYIVPTNTWTHLVFVGTTTNTSIYANGIFRDSTPHAVNLPRLQVGADQFGGADNFHGTLDEIMLFNRALALSEILALYNAGSASVIRTPEFTASSALADGTFQTTILGLTGKTISTYSSTNLIDWTFLNTVTNTNGTLPFTSPIDVAPRFYKATQQ